MDFFWSTEGHGQLHGQKKIQVAQPHIHFVTQVFQNFFKGT